MSNTTWSTVPYAATDADFRTWGSGISTALAAIGLVQTSDTGQINWTTITRASTNSDAGYEVWRFNDAAQSTCPIFIKFYYGTYSSTGYPRLRYEIGSASNGSGTLSGLGSGTLVTWVGGGVDATTRNNFASGDGSGFTLSLSEQSSSVVNITALVVDRFRDSSGAALTDGLYVVKMPSSTSTVTYEVHNRTTSVRSTGNYSLCYIPAAPAIVSGVSFLDGSNVLAFPHFMAIPGLRNVKMILSYALADLGNGSTQAITHLGTSSTYRALGNQHTTGLDSTASAYVSCLMWWA